MKSKIFNFVLDCVLAPLTLFSSFLLKYIRKKGLQKSPVSKRIFEYAGIIPIIDHYYEPYYKKVKETVKRDLPSIDLNIEEQLNVLNQFEFNEEVIRFPVVSPTEEQMFYYDNNYFCSGDAEYLYNMIRLYKPKVIIEIGSGYSTLISYQAIIQNSKDNPNDSCQQICIEPYENRWLKNIDVMLIRDEVQNVDMHLFTKLGANDILFIDSSHTIKPNGDVLHEYLHILPRLRRGVLIHIHDIFTPNDYLPDWIYTEKRIWNEQYLVEAFLSFNDNFKIIGALNYLSHHYQEEFEKKCPVYKIQKKFREPGSFWIRKV